MRQYFYGLLFILYPQLSFALEKENDGCPSTDFNVFVEAFIADEGVQKKHTKYPLRKRQLFDGDPEPMPLYENLNIEQLDFPLIPNRKLIDFEGLKIVSDWAGPDEGWVKLILPDTEYQVIYGFELGLCWTLTQIRNDSF